MVGSKGLDSGANDWLVIEAVKEYATVGEIIQVMKDIYGEYEEPIFF